MIMNRKYLHKLKAIRCSWNPKFPQSLPSRIVACYHNLPAEDACETSPNQASIREALYSSHTCHVGCGVSAQGIRLPITLLELNAKLLVSVNRLP